MNKNLNYHLKNMKQKMINKILIFKIYKLIITVMKKILNWKKH